MRLMVSGLLMCLLLPACADGDRDLPPRYRTLAVPLGAQDARSRGALLFATHCALCHGEKGDGRGARRLGLIRPPRDFTSPEWRRTASPRRVFFTIQEGLRGTAMPAWKATLSEGEAWDITAYVLSLGGAP